MSRRSLGIAFGGGAARGLAHLGVLRVLEEAGVRADYVCGTSAGSIVGALYAGGYSSEELLDVTLALDWADLVRPVLPKLGLVRADRLEAKLEELLGERTIEELPLPFRAVTVDLVGGALHVITEGPVATAVRASCSIPGIFEPVFTGERVLVDGGVLMDVPVPVCREMGADVILAVDLNGDALPGRPPENIFNVLMYSFGVMIRRENAAHMAGKHVVPVVPDLHRFNYYDLRNVEDLMEQGEKAARRAMPRLLKLLGRR